MKTVFKVLAPLLALVAVIGLFTLAELARDYAASDGALGLAEFAWQFFTAPRGEGGSKFLNPLNFQNVWLQTVTVATAALGMTLIIIAGGIDLSAGSALALSSVVLAVTLERHGFGLASGVPPEWQLTVVATLGVLACVACGSLCGLTNGLLITRLRLAPFIVTLGTMAIYRGLAKWPASGAAVRPDRATEVPAWIRDWLMASSPNPHWFTLPPAVWLLIVLALGLAVLLHRTVFGRYIFAIGSNEATARLCGLNVPRIKIAIYSLAGVFVGIGGLLAFSRTKLGNPAEGNSMELDIIAAVVIGGGSLSGGRGSVLGTLVGAAIVRFIRSGCTMLVFEDWFQDVVLGVIIIAAVTLDQWRHPSEREAA